MFAAMQAATAAMEFAMTRLSLLESLSFPETNRTQSIAKPGRIYPIGASAPILPTVPMQRAMPL